MRKLGVLVGLLSVACLVWGCDSQEMCPGTGAGGDGTVLDADASGCFLEPGGSGGDEGPGGGGAGGGPWSDEYLDEEGVCRSTLDVNVFGQSMCWPTFDEALENEDPDCWMRCAGTCGDWLVVHETCLPSVGCTYDPDSRALVGITYFDDVDASFEVVDRQAPGLRWEEDGVAPRFLRGTAFRLHDQASASLRLEGSCGPGCVVQTGLRVDPTGVFHATGVPGCPAGEAGQVIVDDDDGNVFLADEAAEVVFRQHGEPPQALVRGERRIEVRNLRDGSVRPLDGGWGPLLGTPFEEGLRWSALSVEGEDRGRGSRRPPRARWGVDPDPSRRLA